MQFAPITSGLLMLILASSPLAAREIIDSADRPVVLTAARLSATYNIKVEVETTTSGARVARPVLDTKARPNP